MTISTWKPVSQIIDNITQSNPAIVTTVADHGYLDGIFVRIVLPGDFGMNTLNNQVFQATILSSDTFEIDTDTTFLDAFTTALAPKQSPQVIPVGEVAFTLQNAEHNTLTPFSGA